MHTANSDHKHLFAHTTHTPTSYIRQEQQYTRTVHRHHAHVSHTSVYRDGKRHCVQCTRTHMGADSAHSRKPRAYTACRARTHGEQGQLDVLQLQPLRDAHVTTITSMSAAHAHPSSWIFFDYRRQMFLHRRDSSTDELPSIVDPVFVFLYRSNNTYDFPRG